MSIGTIFKKVIHLMLRILNRKKLLRKYCYLDPRNYNKVHPQIDQSFINIFDLELSDINPEVAQHLIQEYTQHHFNLLGSGSVCLDYNIKAYGLHDFLYSPTKVVDGFDEEGNWLLNVISNKHLKYSASLWNEILRTNPKYKPIDWQKDFKSGFRWDAKQIFFNQRKLIAKNPGSDLKVPWELSRLQHLPQMAIYAVKFKDRREVLLKEFKCQLLDFFMSNPIGMGVNFNCAMDVGIRLANILVAYDLFSQLDEKNILGDSFKEVVSTNVYEQMKFVLEELEYNLGNTSNHYLGNISGLLFCGAYFQSNKEIDQVLAFSIQEIIRCSDRQFFEDGGNFEASTCYHRLSGEMMVYSMALILGLDKKKIDSLEGYSNKGWKYKAPLFKPSEQLFNADEILPKRVKDKMANAAIFSNVLNKPNHEMPQFGDNDSGRFLNFNPLGKMMSNKEAKGTYKNLNSSYFENKDEDAPYFDENVLDHSSFVSACIGLYGKDVLYYPQEMQQLESSLIESLSNNSKLTLPVNKNELELIRVDDIQSYEFNKSHNIEFKDINLEGDLKIHYFPDFQLFVARSKNVYCALAGISNSKQHTSLGHSHNDKLSIEVNINGNDITKDPGTYLYTPIPEIRNQFRCTAAHNTLVCDDLEQNTFFKGRSGLFQLKDMSNVKPFILDSNSFGFYLSYGPINQFRKISISSSTIEISDSSNVSFNSDFKVSLYSNGYGKLNILSE